MKITIDTSEDSKEDIRKIVTLLSNFLSNNESSVVNNSSNSIFPDSVSEAGFFGTDDSNSIGLGDKSEANTISTASQSSSNLSGSSNFNNMSSLSNNSSLSGSNSSSQQIQERSMPFMNIFGEDSSANTGSGNSNSGNNGLSNNNSTSNNVSSGTVVSNQPSSSPDIFSVFGNANNNSQSNVGSINQNNIGTSYIGSNLNNNTPAKPKKTFAGIFKGIPILGNINFGQDEQNDELTEEEKKAAKKVVEY